MPLLHLHRHGLRCGLSCLSACILLTSWTAAPFAHAVTHTVMFRQAVVVTATETDGEPLAFERCEVTPPDTTAALSAGRTDCFGRVVFVPDRPGDWRVRIWTEDGHGLDLRVPVPSSMVGDEATAASTAVGDRCSPIPRPVGVLTGIAVLATLAWLVSSRRRGDET